MRVRKAIIPAAGLGTRFLPATKAQPKEMLPIVDKPTIQYIVEEAVASGIEDILIVTGRGKRAIEDHFDKSYELEHALASQGKEELLQEISDISSMVDIYYIRQKVPKGLGHAIWCARKFIGHEPFAVLLGDDIVVSDPPCLRQLLDVYDRLGRTVVGVRQVPDRDVTQYGIISPETETLPATEGRVMRIMELIEKPAPHQAPSNYAIMGRYVLEPEIFPILENLSPGAGNEIQLTDALQLLNKRQDIYAYEFSGQRYDVGSKLGFVQATLDFALRNDVLREEVIRYMEQKLGEWRG
jgi:UTP--glucose-1-phosphate uridylyltransferase